MSVKKIANLKVAYRQGTVDEETIEAMFKNDTYFMRPYVPRKGDVVIDIGSHIGTFSLFVASKVKDSRVYAIEASRENFEYLKENIKLNNFNNISAHNLALSDSKGTAVLHHDVYSGNVGHSMTMKFTDQGESVTANTLAGFMQDNNIIHCDYARFNCEGSEFKIIPNTPRKILQRISVINILYHLDLVENCTEDDLIRHLSKCGFSTNLRILSDIHGYDHDKKERPTRGVVVALNENFIEKVGFLKKLQEWKNFKKSAKIILDKQIF